MMRGCLIAALSRLHRGGKAAQATDSKFWGINNLHYLCTVQKILGSTTTCLRSSMDRTKVS